MVTRQDGEEGLSEDLWNPEQDVFFVIFIHDLEIDDLKGIIIKQKIYKLQITVSILINRLDTDVWRYFHILIVRPWTFVPICLLIHPMTTAEKPKFKNTVFPLGFTSGSNDSLGFSAFILPWNDSFAHVDVYER